MKTLGRKQGGVGFACAVSVFLALAAGSGASLAGDDLGVHAFLRGAQKTAPAQRRSAPLPSLFVPSSPFNRQILGYAPFDTRLDRYTPGLERQKSSPRRASAVIDTDRAVQSGLIDDRAFGRGRNAGNRGYCVRLCDGYYFPLSHIRGGENEQQATCDSLCPSAKTRLYSADPGRGDIERASFKGETYSSLPAAFLYRTKTSRSCTCTSSGFGLATSSVLEDPTLKRGDVVAFEKGLRVYRGGEGRQAESSDFTPLANSTLLTAGERRKLSELIVRSEPRLTDEGDDRTQASVIKASVAPAFQPLTSDGTGRFERSVAETSLGTARAIRSVDTP